MIAPNHPINMPKQDTAHFSAPNLGTKDIHWSLKPCLCALEEGIPHQKVPEVLIDFTPYSPLGLRTLLPISGRSDIYDRYSSIDWKRSRVP